MAIRNGSRWNMNKSNHFSNQHTLKTAASAAVHEHTQKNNDTYYDKNNCGDQSIHTVTKNIGTPTKKKAIAENKRRTYKYISKICYQFFACSFLAARLVFPIRFPSPFIFRFIIIFCPFVDSCFRMRIIANV